MTEHFKGEDLETRVQQLEEEMALLKGDSRLADLPYGTLKQARSIFSLRSVGGANGRYPAGAFPISYPSGAGAITANRLYAIPFYMPDVPNRVVEMGLRVTGASAGAVRLGIYADKKEDQLYPGRLLLDAGTVDTSTTGEKSITMREGLPRGLIWVALIGNSAVPAFTRYGYADPGWALLGYTSGASPRSIYYVSQAYGALPNPFPASASEYGIFTYVYLKFG